MEKIRSSNCFSCCFRGGPDSMVAGEDRSQPASLIRSSSTWIRTKAHEIPEIKEKCRGLISRIGKPRRHSGDFRYDPLSYALNFDEGADYDDDGEISPAEFRYRSFSSRLPPSPPQPTAGAAGASALAAAKEIACS